MELEHLATLHPVLYHMADARNWFSIERHGLLSTSVLLDRCAVSGARRDVLEASHRPAIVALSGASGTVFVRDQHPLDPSVLAGCLDDMTPEAWYRVLNARVFFWPTRDRLERMLKAYGREEQAVFAVDTRELLGRHAGKTELSHINSGFASKLYRPARRGRHTFVPLRDYAYSARNKIAEVTVLGSVPDIFEVTRRVTIQQRGRDDRVLWQPERVRETPITFCHQKGL